MLYYFLFNNFEEQVLFAIKNIEKINDYNIIYPKYYNFFVKHLFKKNSININNNGNKNLFLGCDDLLKNKEIKEEELYEENVIIFASSELKNKSFINIKLYLKEETLKKKLFSLKIPPLFDYKNLIAASFCPFSVYLINLYNLNLNDNSIDNTFLESTYLPKFQNDYDENFEKHIKIFDKEITMPCRYHCKDSEGEVYIFNKNVFDMNSIYVSLCLLKSENVDINGVYYINNEEKHNCLKGLTNLDIGFKDIDPFSIENESYIIEKLFKNDKSDKIKTTSLGFKNSYLDWSKIINNLLLILKNNKFSKQKIPNCKICKFSDLCELY